MKTRFTTLLTAAGVSAVVGIAVAEDAKMAPDNTGVNARDSGKLTATDQSEKPADRQISAQIRQAVVADESLSMTAHNVKIITIDGVVTLRGPVKTDQEKSAIASKAQQIAGVKRVDNQLEITNQ